MSRPRAASVEAKLEIAALKVKIATLEKDSSEFVRFKERVELGQKWLLCAALTIGGIATFLASITTFLSYFKDR